MLVTALAAAPRLILFALQGGALASPPMDQELYLRMAGSLSEGRGLSFDEGSALLKAENTDQDNPLRDWASDRDFVFGIAPTGAPTATIEPGYPVLLAAAFSLSGPTTGAVFMVNLLAQVLGAWAVYLLASGFSGRKAGLASAACYSVYPYFVFYTSAAMTEAVHVAMIPVILLATLRSERGGAAPLFAGAATGLLFLVRSTALFLLPLQIIHEAAGRRWRGALLVTAGFAAMAAPWVVRNRIEMGSPVLLPTKGSLNLWMRNNPEALELEGIRIPESIMEGISRTDLLDYPDFEPDQGELERSDELAERSAGFIAANPLLFAWLSARRLIEYLSPLPSGRGGGLAAIAAGFGMYLPLAALSIAGVARNRRNRGIVLAASVFVLYAGIHALAHGGLRYRLPADTVLMVLAPAAFPPARRRSE